MPSETDICNMALDAIGIAETIPALGDLTTVPGRKCNLYYAVTRDALLRKHPWNFAQRRRALALVSTETPVGYTYAYAYPSDCIEVLEIYRSVSTARPTCFTVGASADLKQKLIFTDQEDAYLVYTARITDTNMYDPAFVEALVYRLAFRLAPSLTASPDMTRAMAVAAEEAFRSAARVNANESEDMGEYTSAYASARL